MSKTTRKDPDVELCVERAKHIYEGRSPAASKGVF
jgi:hypothetical protein